jgi:hypothetical protein
MTHRITHLTANLRKKKDNYGSIAEMKQISRKLFEENKVSDEYYTQKETWEEWTDGNVAIADNREFIEPFFGDGTGINNLKQLGVKVSGTAYADFWDWIENFTPNDKSYVLSNQTYSFKWLIIYALMRKGVRFTMIVPWQMFFKSSLGRLAQYQKKFGGTFTYSRIINNKFKTPEGEMKKIGTYFLTWDFS